MAADRATVSISASLLPDEIKASVGGTTVYDIDDLEIKECEVIKNVQR